MKKALLAFCFVVTSFIVANAAETDPTVAFNAVFERFKATRPVFKTDRTQLPIIVHQDRPAPKVTVLTDVEPKTAHIDYDVIDQWETGEKVTYQWRIVFHWKDGRWVYAQVFNRQKDKKVLEAIVKHNPEWIQFVNEYR